MTRSAREAMRDAFADRVAEHGDLFRASKETKVTQGVGRALWSEIKRGLGPQAR